MVQEQNLDTAKFTSEHQQKMWVLAGILCGMLLGSLDQTIVGTAMPKVIASLGGMNLYAWAFTSYMLASTASVPIFGKLSDMYGRKYFYIGSLIIFMLGSIFCGGAHTMVELIIFRGLQGLGAGSMMANAASIIADIFPPAQRGRYQGLIGGVFGIASILGPTLGGFITDQLNWRWVFYVNIPVGILAVIILTWAMPKIKLTVIESIDYCGVATLLLAAISMLLAFSWAGKDYAWNSSMIIGLLTVSAFSWVAFILIEIQAKEPILPMSLFKNRIFSLANIVVFFVGAGMFGTIIFLPLYLQSVIGLSATNSGLLLTPMMLAMVVSSVTAGQVITRTGKYKWLTVASLMVMALGMLMMSRMTQSTTVGEVRLLMIIFGLGLGVTMPVFNIMIQNAVPFHQVGTVTAANQFFRSIGGTIGVAIYGTFLSANVEHHVAGILPARAAEFIPPDRLKAMMNPQVLISPEALSQIKAGASPFALELLNKIINAMKAAIVGGIHDIFGIGFLIIMAAVLVSLLLKDIPLRRTNKMPILENAESAVPVAEEEIADRS